MQESVIYQEILQEGIEQGQQQGQKQEALSLVNRLLVRRVGELAPELQEQVQGLELAQLEALGEALLDFTQVSDLQDWLQTQASH